MLPKANRFQFKSNLPKQTLNSDSFSLRYDKNEKELKVAVVVSKKVDKRAVARNRIKRIIMNAVAKSITAGSNLTLIFYVKSSYKEESLANEVAEVFQKIK